jgi:integrase
VIESGSYDVLGHLQRTRAKLKARPTEPFTKDEMLRINAAATEQVLGVGSSKARQLRALVLLLRYSGLRISDAVSCSIDRLRDGKIWLRTRARDPECDGRDRALNL